ncbi:hypothetical protein ARMGADRAFT_385512 [Armillaria gallica]|uniref:Uncharacterized protein n=1 Tax=Armillaria gallica TaxID=47427 RepID=A0A2H3ENM9_ARMGA|nr:hypothetical protein ARMGADRAFT_385512 [Armillaria gallica]
MTMALEDTVTLLGRQAHLSQSALIQVTQPCCLVQDCGETHTLGRHTSTLAPDTSSTGAGPSIANTSDSDERDYRGALLRITGVAAIYRATLGMSAAGEPIAEVPSVRSGGPAVDVKRKRVSEDDQGTGKRWRMAERSMVSTTCASGSRFDTRQTGDITSSLPKHLKRKRDSTHDNGITDWIARDRGQPSMSIRRQ